jgi:hypothetical protein
LSPTEHLEEIMQEVLFKTADSNVPLQEQELFELRLDDLGFRFWPHFVDIVGTVAHHRYMVLETHAAWSEKDRDIIWDGYEHDQCSTLEEAELSYELRRAALVLKGFIYSDMKI